MHSTWKRSTNKQNTQKHLKWNKTKTHMVNLITSCPGRSKTHTPTTRTASKNANSPTTRHTNITCALWLKEIQIKCQQSKLWSWTSKIQREWLTRTLLSTCSSTEESDGWLGPITLQPGLGLGLGWLGLGWCRYVIWTTRASEVWHCHHSKRIICWLQFQTMALVFKTDDTKQNASRWGCANFGSGWCKSAIWTLLIIIPSM